MTQEEKVEQCLKCRFKKFDLNRGLLCNITNMPVDFETECPDYWDENHFEKIKSEKELLKKCHRKTLFVFSIILISELLLVASLLLTKSFADFFIFGLIGVFLNAVTFIAILARQKWAKILLTLFFSFVIIAGLIFTIYGTLFIKASPNLIIKVIAAIVICSNTVYFLNFNKSFLVFFNFKNLKIK